MEMKFGSETGSIINHVLSGVTNMPVVGKGATILSWSDRRACEVISVSNGGKTAIIQKYKPKCVNVELQEYIYNELEPNKIEITYRYKKWWVIVNRNGKKEYVSINIRFGFAETYQDPSF